MIDQRPVFDEQDEEIVNKCMELYWKRPGPEVGDWIVFSDGIERRIAHVWSEKDWPENSGVQVASGEGSFYLGEYGISYSGGLQPIVSFKYLTKTDNRYMGAVWIFHHKYQKAHNGVTTRRAFRVYNCSVPCP